jgi:hypothetical protein
MVRASNLVYYLREIQHFGQVRLFPKSARLLLYLDGEQSQDRLMVLKAVMKSLCRDLHSGRLDEWKEVELQVFVERLFAFGASQHVAVQIPGMKAVRRFKARIPDRGVVVRKDNSHPNCMEFEFNVPTPVKALAAHIEKQTSVLTGFTQQIQTHLSVLRGINEAVNGLTQATNDLENVLKSLKFSGKNRRGETLNLSRMWSKGLLLLEFFCGVLLSQRKSGRQMTGLPNSSGGISREQTIDYQNPSEPPDPTELDRLPWTNYREGGGQWVFSDLTDPVAQQLRAYLESVRRRVVIGDWNYRICGKPADPHAFIARNPIEAVSKPFRRDL